MFLNDKWWGLDSDGGEPGSQVLQHLFEGGEG